MGKTTEKSNLEKARVIAADLLESGAVDGILGLRRAEDHVEPYLFAKADDVSELDITGSYPVAGVVRRLLEMGNGETLGVIARGCDERHLIELAKSDSIDLERVKVIGVACTDEEAKQCHCTRPYPDKVDIGVSIGDVDYRDHEKLSWLVGLDVWDRRRFWTETFNRCIKCYGCRNACPLCHCDDCRLEESRWVRVGEIPPEFPSFHLIRAFHLADKCVGCGSCERACPMGIPLGQLHQLIREVLESLFNYRAGVSVEDVSPLHSDLEKGPMEVPPDEL